MTYIVFDLNAFALTMVGDGVVWLSCSDSAMSKLQETLWTLTRREFIFCRSLLFP